MLSSGTSHPNSLVPNPSNTFPHPERAFMAPVLRVALFSVLVSDQPYLQRRQWLGRTYPEHYTKGLYFVHLRSLVTMQEEKATIGFI